MMKLGDVVRTADFKAEKHVPVIECPDKAAMNVPFNVTVSVGKEISHPNTTEHHIKWIDLYVHYENDPNTVHLGRYDFGPVVSDPIVTVKVKLQKKGTLIALSYCNLHGLWESKKEINLE